MNRWGNNDEQCLVNIVPLMPILEDHSHTTTQVNVERDAHQGRLVIGSPARQRNVKRSFDNVREWLCLDKLGSD